MSGLTHRPIVALEDLAETIDYGHTASAIANPSGPKFLRITDIQDGAVDWTSVPFCVCEGKDERKYSLTSGDIVFARTGATTGKSFLIRDCPDRSVFASYLIRVRPNSRVLPEYLAHYFQTRDYWAYITRSSSGTGQPGVNASNLRRLPVPLPPLSEQKRIAAILDKADALRRKRRKAVAKLDTLLQSVFLEMFGDPETNPKKWEVSSLGTLFRQSPNFGTMIPPKVDGGSWLSLRVANIQNWALDLTDSKYVDLDPQSIERHSVIDGDLLMARAIASQEHLGKCIVVYPGTRKWAFDSHLVRLRFDTDQVLPEYIRRVLMTPGGRALFLRNTRKSTVQFNINTKEVSALSLPIPPIELQHRFETIIHRINKERAKQLSQLSGQEQLFSALQQEHLSS